MVHLKVGIGEIHCLKVDKVIVTPDAIQGEETKAHSFGVIFALMQKS